MIRAIARLRAPDQQMNNFTAASSITPAIKDHGRL
jgi:hypothetical protein